MAEAFTGPRVELLLLYGQAVKLSSTYLHLYCKPGLFSALVGEAFLCDGQRSVEGGRAGQSVGIRLSTQPLMDFLSPLPQPKLGQWEAGGCKSWRMGGGLRNVFGTWHGHYNHTTYN